jgi:hypothetical protein
LTFIVNGILERVGIVVGAVEFEEDEKDLERRKHMIL